MAFLRVLEPFETTQLFGSDEDSLACAAEFPRVKYQDRYRRYQHGRPVNKIVKTKLALCGSRS